MIFVNTHTASCMVRRSKFGSVSCHVEKRKSSKGTRPNKSQPLGFNIVPAFDSESTAVAAIAPRGKIVVTIMTIHAREAEMKFLEESTLVHVLKKRLVFDKRIAGNESFFFIDDGHALLILYKRNLSFNGISFLLLLIVIAFDIVVDFNITGELYLQ